MNYFKETADRYIRQNLDKGSKDFKPRYHFSAQVGWINDPNGLIYYDGYFHIFYQYYPYGLEWGPMHWGHARSKNLVDFEYLPVALAPDAPDESGCFSGGAVIDKNRNLLHLLYTRHYEKENVIKQTQYHAVSADGVRFTKTERAAIGEELLPEGFTTCSFRDPNPVIIGDTYYVVVGAQTKDRAGAVLVYSSQDMSEFKYEFAIENENFGEMVECPDLFCLDGKMVLTFSVVALKNEELTNIDGKASLYAVMNVDFEKRTYEFLHIDSLDEGTDFYAPQTLEDKNGRRIMLAWLDMWNNNAFSKKNQLISNGVYTLPRDLALENGRLLQYPIQEVKDVFRDRMNVVAGAEMSKTAYLEMEMREGSEFSFGYESDYISLRVEDGRFTLTQRQKNHITAVRKGKYQSDAFHVEVFTDRCSLEVFTDNRDVFSSQVFIECEKYTVLRMERVKILRAASV